MSFWMLFWCLGTLNQANDVMDNGDLGFSRHTIVNLLVVLVPGMSEGTLFPLVFPEVCVINASKELVKEIFDSRRILGPSGGPFGNHLDVHLEIIFSFS